MSYAYERYGSRVTAPLDAGCLAQVFSEFVLCKRQCSLRETVVYCPKQASDVTILGILSRRNESNINMPNGLRLI